jgi:hypothetical protein
MKSSLEDSQRHSGPEVSECSSILLVAPTNTSRNSPYAKPTPRQRGTGTLSIDGKMAAQGKIERTIHVRFSLDETLDVGEDTGMPVVEDYGDKMPFKFTGTIGKVVVELGKSGLAANDEKTLEEYARKVAAVRE